MAPVYQPMYTRKAIPSAPTCIHSFIGQIVATFIVSTIFNLSFFAINHTTFLLTPYELPPSINNIFTRASPFSSLLSFSLHIFSWAFKTPEVFFELSFCAFTCLSNNSLISQWISAKLVSALLQCMHYLSYYFHITLAISQ